MRFLLRLPCIAMPLFRLMALSILIAAASGCIPVGVPLPPEGDPFTEKKLDFIETGTITKDEIRLTLAEPPFELSPQVFHGGKVWVYSTETKGWGGAGCYIAYGGGGDCGVDWNTKNHLLLLRFDEQGIVDYWFEAEGPRFSALAIVVIAEFGVELQEDGSNFQTHDGLTVEARKPNDVDEVRFKGNEEMLLVVKQDPDESWRQIYFGDVKPARDAGSKPDGGSYYVVNASTLEELNAGVP